jgi:putative spermidine/putrescine transport system ATP-binding protein
MASVRLDGIGKTYPNGHVAAQGLDLEIADGEFMVLVGPSGCGKSTALRMIAGLETPTVGRIMIGDKDVTSLPPQERDIAMVFQTYALYPHMTVHQNLAFGLRMRGAAREVIDRRVEEAARALALEPVLARKPAQLSGGQRQRVALGRALAVSPQLLLLDEPLSNLDARIREDVRHEIKALQAKLGITTIHVTHDREEAMVMADRIAILDAGRIAQLGSPEQVYNRPNSPFVASFMGAGNVLELQARPANGGIRIEAGAHNDSVLIPGSTIAGPLTAHFRSEAAQLGPAGGGAPDQLLLRGRIVQASYPGGFYRYAVAVGQNQFMVDDTRRLAVGEAVGIGLPVTSLHLFSRREA